MNKSSKELYLEGIKVGMPIAIIYFIVSFAFGISVVNLGMPWWYATLISASNLTSAGQFAGINLITILGSFAEIAATVVFVNFRYFFMGLSLSQKLDSKIGYFKRLLISLFITDEIFAISITRGNNVKFSFFMGLATMPYFGWAFGTMAGGLANGILPSSLQVACGIALYCMFIAIIIPPALKSRSVVLSIALAILFSCVFYYVPYLVEKVSFGFRVIIATVLSATITSILFPINVEKQDREALLEEYKNTCEYIREIDGGAL